MNHGFTYQSTFTVSDIVHWRIADIIGGDKRLDFSKAFMPESFARVEPLSFLNQDEKRVLNQIRGCTQADRLLNSVFGERFKDGC